MNKFFLTFLAIIFFECPTFALEEISVPLAIEVDNAFSKTNRTINLPALRLECTLEQLKVVAITPPQKTILKFFTAIRDREDSVLHGMIDVKEGEGLSSPSQVGAYLFESYFKKGLNIQFLAEVPLGIESHFILARSDGTNIDFPVLSVVLKNGQFLIAMTPPHPFVSVLMDSVNANKGIEFLTKSRPIEIVPANHWTVAERFFANPDNAQYVNIKKTVDMLAVDRVSDAVTPYSFAKMSSGGGLVKGKSSWIKGWTGSLYNVDSVLNFGDILIAIQSEQSGSRRLTYYVKSSGDQYRIGNMGLLTNFDDLFSSLNKKIKGTSK